MKSFDTKQKRTLIYVEDHQMYYKNYWLVETTYTGDLHELSYDPPMAGRISTSVDELKALVEDEGEWFDPVENLGKKLPKKYKDLPLVFGATGNY
jgi:hypothetical protein